MTGDDALAMRSQDAHGEAQRTAHRHGVSSTRTNGDRAPLVCAAAWGWAAPETMAGLTCTFLRTSVMDQTLFCLYETSVIVRDV